jgi:thiamine-monophosphate kinase
MFENKVNRTELENLGEFGLIERIKQGVQIYNSESIKGIGDDAAVIDSLGKRTLITTDMLVEGVHFDLSFHPLKHLGYKSVVVNLSDIYAMNGIPKQIIVAFAISSRFSLEAVEELYEGINLACEKYKIDLIGGDTTSSTSGLTITVTAIGYAETDEIVYRSGAGENDLLCVSGDLGGAYLGLQVLEREKRIFMENPGIQPDLSGNDYILERQLKPEARKDIIESLHKLKLRPTSMIDISDGLSSEILHLCKASGLGCDLYADKIPIDPQTIERAGEFNLDPTVCALSGGEDYELLFTIRQEDYETLRPSTDISIIGHMKDKASGANLIDRNGSSFPLRAQGWDALLKR